MPQIDEEKLVREPDYTYNDLQAAYPKIINSYDKCRMLEQDILDIRASKVLGSDYQDKLKATERSYLSYRQGINTRDYNALKQLAPQRTSSFDYCEKALNVYCIEHGNETVTDEGLSEIHTAAGMLKEYLANMLMSLSRKEYNKFENPLEALEECGVTMSEKSIQLLAEGFIDRTVAREAKCVKINSDREHSAWKKLQDPTFIKNCDPEKLDENKIFDKAVFQRAYQLGSNDADWGEQEVITMESIGETFYGGEFEGITFKDTKISLGDMANTSLVHAVIEKSSIDRTDMSNSVMIDAIIDDVNIFGCDMTDCDLMGAKQTNVRYLNCDLKNASFDYAELGTEEEPVVFGFNTDLCNASFNGAHLVNVTFDNVKNLETISLDGAKLSPKVKKELEEKGLEQDLQKPMSPEEIEPFSERLKEASRTRHM